MIPRTQDIQPEANGAAHAPDSSERFTQMPGNSPLTATLDLATEVAARYDISDLSGLLASARALSGGEEISVAVLGRFKAGKSSFLNHFLGRSFLPVGVVPVTSVVTKIRYGVHEEARVHHQDGRELAEHSGPAQPQQGLEPHVTGPMMDPWQAEHAVNVALRRA